jgi:myo-inositol-1(or 4)-monophosphatase
MDLVTKAIKFASDAHDGQRRKSGNVPYIMHPLEAAIIVSTMTDDQELIAAALLHDVVEDAGITSEQVEQGFGHRVAELVASETEDKREELPPSATWRIRKEESLDVLRKATDEAVLMVWLGDKLANIRAIYREWLTAGSSIWQKFNQKDEGEQEWYYRSIAKLTSSLSDHPAWQEYDRLTREIFGKEDDGCGND